MTKEKRETRVLVLYTGGTIGMKKMDGGKLKYRRFISRDERGVVVEINSF